jgi:hypothetical protein
LQAYGGLKYTKPTWKWYTSRASLAGKLTD